MSAAEYQVVLEASIRVAAIDSVSIPHELRADVCRAAEELGLAPGWPERKLIAAAQKARSYWLRYGVVPGGDGPDQVSRFGRAPSERPTAPAAASPRGPRAAPATSQDGSGDGGGKAMAGCLVVAGLLAVAYPLALAGLHWMSAREQQEREQQERAEEEQAAQWNRVAVVQRFLEQFETDFCRGEGTASRLSVAGVHWKPGWNPRSGASGVTVEWSEAVRWARTWMDAEQVRILEDDGDAVLWLPSDRWDDLELFDTDDTRRPPNR